MVEPPLAVQGRGGGIRYKTARADLLPLLAYFPPRPSASRRVPFYPKACDILVEAWRWWPRPPNLQAKVKP